MKRISVCAFRRRYRPGLNGGRRKGQVFEANDHIRRPGNHRGATQDPLSLSAFARQRQELTSRYYQLRHMLHLFDAVVTPTITYGVGTWTTTEEHETMLQTAQRGMDGLVIQTKRTYKKKKQRRIRWKRHPDMSEGAHEEDSTNDEYDQDSSISFENDTESTSSQDEELEDWIEYTKRSAGEVDGTMLALRIATQSPGRWT